MSSLRSDDSFWCYKVSLRLSSTVAGQQHCAYWMVSDPLIVSHCTYRWCKESVLGGSSSGYRLAMERAGTTLKLQSWWWFFLFSYVIRCIYFECPVTPWLEVDWTELVHRRLYYVPIRSCSWKSPAGSVRSVQMRYHFLQWLPFWALRKRSSTFSAPGWLATKTALQIALH